MNKLHKLTALLLALLLLPFALPAQAEDIVTLYSTSWAVLPYADQFHERYPNIQVEYVENESAIQDSILTGASIDVYQVDAAGTWEEILSKGYAAPMANEALMAKASRLLPALQEVCIRDGKLMGFPSQLTLETWALDVTAWEEVGFTEDQIPATIADFLSLWETWQYDLANDFSQYYFLETNGRDPMEYIVSVLVRQHIAAHETPDAPVSFDTPAFHQALAQLEKSKDLFQVDELKSEAIASYEMMPLIYNYCAGYGYVGFDEHQVRGINIPSLDENTPAFTEGVSYVYFVNARSQHPEEAALLIDFLEESMHASQRYDLYADLNQPIESSFYLENKDNFAAELADVTEKLKACTPDERQALEERQIWLENWFAREDDIRWTISPADIAVHFSLIENLRVPTKSLYLASDSNCYDSLTTLISRYAAGEITADNFIAEMDRTCSLAFREQ